MTGRAHRGLVGAERARHLGAARLGERQRAGQEQLGDGGDAPLGVAQLLGVLAHAQDLQDGRQLETAHARQEPFQVVRGDRSAGAVPRRPPGRHRGGRRGHKRCRGQAIDAAAWANSALDRIGTQPTQQTGLVAHQSALRRPSANAGVHRLGTTCAGRVQGRACAWQPSGQEPFPSGGCCPATQGGCHMQLQRRRPPALAFSWISTGGSNAPLTSHCCRVCLIAAARPSP